MHGSHGPNEYFRAALFTFPSRHPLCRKDPAKQTGLVSMQMSLGPGDQRRRETKTIITRHEVGTTAARLFRSRESLRRRCTPATTGKSRQTETNDGRKTENSLPRENRLSEKRVFHGLTILRTNSRANEPFFSYLDAFRYISLLSTTRLKIIHRI